MVTPAELFLSVQRALLGVTPSALCAVACGWQKHRITLRFIFDDPIIPDDDDAALIPASNPRLFQEVSGLPPYFLIFCVFCTYAIMDLSN